MNRLAILAIPVLLSGCGIPPAVTIATYALDGAVLAASGKTVRDHALSAVVEQDCSMFRVISGSPICVDYEPNDAAADALETMSDSEEMLTVTSDGRVIRVAAMSSPNVTADGPMIAESGPDVVDEPAAAAANVSTERVLLTTEDGRQILVADTPDDDSQDHDGAVSPLRLSWEPPQPVQQATR